MSNEHSFKKGDRVFLKGDNSFGGTIVEVGAYCADIVWDCEPNEIYLQLLDAIEHTDRRTDFLTRLQSMMKEFDAEIIFHCDYKLETLATSIIVGESELRRNEVYGVTANNIMDFDKE